MKSFMRKIPNVPSKSDLKIIYEDGQNELHQFLVQKDEFLKKLRYYQNKKYEIDETGVIYIHEYIDHNNFQAFVSAIEKEEVEINNNNYSDLFNLSQKYQYDELLSIVKEFIEQRPDICEVIDELSQKVDQEESQINYEKEEQIAKNLDFCLKHGNLQKLPLSMLTRVLNSPKRVVNDHHALFAFIMKILDESSKQKIGHEDEENLGILVSSLDYLEMSNDELEQLFTIKCYHDAFKPRNSEEKIKMFISEEKEMKAKLDEQEKMFSKRLSEVEKALENALLQLEQMTEKDRVVEKRLAELEKGQIKSVKKEKVLEEKINDQNLIVVSNKSRIKDIQTFNNEMKSSSQQIKNEQTKAKSEIEELNKTVSDLQDMLFSKECHNKIFKTLFSENNENPSEKGLVEVTGNSDIGEQIWLPKLIDSKWTSDYWVSKNEENSYIQIDFKKFLVKIIKYRILIGKTDGSGFFNSWVLKGIKEDNCEIVLDEVNNSSEISNTKLEILRPIKKYLFVRSIRLTMKGKSSLNDYYMRMRNIELFGYIKK